MQHISLIKLLVLLKKSPKFHSTCTTLHTYTGYRNVNSLNRLNITRLTKPRTVMSHRGLLPLGCSYMYQDQYFFFQREQAPVVQLISCFIKILPSFSLHYRVQYSKRSVNIKPICNSQGVSGFTCIVMDIQYHDLCVHITCNQYVPQRRSTYCLRGRGSKGDSQRAKQVGSLWSLQRILDLYRLPTVTVTRLLISNHMITYYVFIIITGSIAVQICFFKKKGRDHSKKKIQSPTPTIILYIHTYIKSSLSTCYYIHVYNNGLCLSILICLCLFKRTF